MTDYTPGRLHCCGGHGGGSIGAGDRPNGLEIVLGASGVTAYGTGDNLDSACIILADVTTTTPADRTQDGADDRTLLQMYADILARGANLTVLIPENLPTVAEPTSHQIDGRKRKLSTAISDLEAKHAAASTTTAETISDQILRLARALRDMDVSYIGLLVINDAGLAVELGSDARLRDEIKCVALASTESPPLSEAWPYKDLVLPLSHVLLGHVEGPAEPKTSDANALQRLTSCDAPRDFYRHAVQHGGHQDVTRELIYWLKKHLHDWS